MWGGVLLDEYYKLFDITILNELAEIISYIGGARNALFFAMPLLLIGGLVASREEKLLRYRRSRLAIACIILFVFGFVEATILRNNIGTNITVDLSIFGWTPSVPLLLLGLRVRSMVAVDDSRRLRKITGIVYIIHVWVIIITDELLGIEYLSRFMIVTLISFALATGCILLVECARKRKQSIK